MKRFFRRVIDSNRADFVTAILGIIGIIIFVPVATYYFFAKDLTSAERIMNRNSTGLTLFDRNNEIFFQFYEAKYKQFIPLSQIPKNVQKSVVIAEDKEFYEHPGFSIKSIVGAFIANIRHGKIAYGGSTITQQLVKNTLLGSQRNFLRKYQEVVLAQEIERRYTKNQILEMYLNSVYFGEGAFGIQEAAKTYFNLPAKDLTLSQASLLAGMITAPSQLSPISGDKKKSIDRQHFILSQLKEHGDISESELISAQVEPFRFRPQQELRYKAPHFALMVRDALIQRYGEERVARSGFKIRTTLDLSWQKEAEAAVKEQVQKLAGDQVTNGAAVVIDPQTGEIRALVGSKDWYDTSFGKVNMAMAPRQPGSSFKPIVYITALEKHLITAATLLKDQPITYQTVVGPYRPQNYDRTFRGFVTTRRALANSLNVPAVEVMKKVGVPEVVASAKRFGITTLTGDDSTYGLSLVLGAGEVPLVEMTNVFATFAHKGSFVKYTTILDIYDKDGTRIYIYNPQPKEVIAPEYAFLVSSILSDNKTRAEVFGNVLNISRPAAVKTGTSEDYRDSLTIGYTPSLAVGVWVGNNDNRPMNQIAGALGAAPIWKTLMEKFLSDKPVEQFEQPAGIVSAPLCIPSGTASKPAISMVTEYFVNGTQPTTRCAIPSPTQTAQPQQVIPTIKNTNQDASRGQVPNDKQKKEKDKDH